MKNLLKNLIAFGLFATLFAQPTFAQKVQLTLVKVEAGEMQMQAEPTTELVEQKLHGANSRHRKCHPRIHRSGALHRNHYSKVPSRGALY